MKRIVFLMCLTMFNVSLSDEIDTEEYEIQLEYDEQEGERVLPPLSIHISVINSSDSSSNNTTHLNQDQVLEKKELENKKKQSNYQRFVKYAVVSAIILSIPQHQDPLTLYRLWNF